jgi:hypothetical protein
LGTYKALKNQVFKITLENDKYTIMSAVNGGTLEVPDSSNTSGLQVVISQPNNTAN